MTKAEFDTIFDTCLAKLVETRNRKHKEYAQVDETFLNLKRGGQILEVHPTYYAFYLMTKQYNSVHEMTRSKNEVEQWFASDELPLLWEKVQDIVIYCLLIYGMAVEEVRQREGQIALIDRGLQSNIGGDSHE